MFPFMQFYAKYMCYIFKLLIYTNQPTTTHRETSTTAQQKLLVTKCDKAPKTFTCKGLVLIIIIIEKNISRRAGNENRLHNHNHQWNHHYHCYSTSHTALPIIPPAAASTMAAVLFQSSWYSSFVPLRFVHPFYSVAGCVSHLLFCKAACKLNDNQIMVAERGMMLWVANVWDKKAPWKLGDLFSVLCFTSNMYHSVL